MLIDCDACAVRGPACGDCVVTVLLGAPPARRFQDGVPGIDLDGREQAAIAVLAECGLIPPLRLVSGPTAPSGDPAVGAEEPERDWAKVSDEDWERAADEAWERASDAARGRPDEGSGGGRRAAV